MQVIRTNGILVAVLPRDHCPPHMHADGSNWTARFQFAFWTNGVALWDITGQIPSASSIEELRQKLANPTVLASARKRWWNAFHTICLDNQHWDLIEQRVKTPAQATTNTRPIVQSSYNPAAGVTKLVLKNIVDPLEIEL